MPTQLNACRRVLLAAVAVFCLACSNSSLARAQDPSVNDTANPPASTPVADDPTAKPGDSAEPSDAAKPGDGKPQGTSDEKGDIASSDKAKDKPAANEANKPVDKKDEGSKDADKKDADKKEPEKKDADKPGSEMKESEKNDADKKDSDKKDSEKKESDKKESESAAKPAKTPRRISGLGSFDGVQLRNQPWKIHDIRRPHPPVVTPGELSTYEKPGTAPSDAIVLFDGTDLSQWAHLDKDMPNELIEAQWKIQNGYFEITPGFGSLQTLEGFGSCHLHIEWQAPAQVRGEGQNRGNSGIKFMSSFEIQILDSFNNRTYADGQAGAIYGQYPPMVNAARKPGEWQVYDILFIAPKFSLDGKLERPASATVMHNGIFVQNAREYAGPSGAHGAMYSPLTPAAPIMLQDHGCPVRFRNIWVRNIPDND